MADTYKTCTERAVAAGEAAKKATLANVRERELRAQKTWQALADQARAVAMQREQLEKEKAARQAAETDAETSAEQAVQQPAE